MGLGTSAGVVGFLRRRCTAPALSSPGPAAGDRSIAHSAQLSAPALAVLAGGWQAQLFNAVQYVAEDGFWDDASAAPLRPDL
eukprot:3161184-Alexandrium_andersonii.AAC.1